MKKLFVDLEKQTENKECPAKCSYFYHPKNTGITSLRELATFATVCRQCDEAPCVKSCPTEALEKQEDNILKRYNMRCIGCKSCAIACPFGTIYPELIPFLASKCDYCLDRLGGDKLPLCVETCPSGAIQYTEIEADPAKDLFAIGKNLIVHSIPWKKEEVKKEK